MDPELDSWVNSVLNNAEKPTPFMKNISNLYVPEINNNASSCGSGSINSAGNIFYASSQDHKAVPIVDIFETIRNENAENLLTNARHHLNTQNPHVLALERLKNVHSNSTKLKTQIVSNISIKDYSGGLPDLPNPWYSFYVTVINAYKGKYSANMKTFVRQETIHLEELSITLREMFYYIYFLLFSRLELHSSISAGMLNLNETLGNLLGSHYNIKSSLNQNEKPESNSPKKDSVTTDGIPIKNHSSSQDSLASSSTKTPSLESVIYQGEQRVWSSAHALVKKFGEISTNAIMMGSHHHLMRAGTVSDLIDIMLTCVMESVVLAYRQVFIKSSHELHDGFAVAVFAILSKLLTGFTFSPLTIYVLRRRSFPTILHTAFLDESEENRSKHQNGLSTTRKLQLMLDEVSDNNAHQTHNDHGTNGTISFPGRRLSSNIQQSISSTFDRKKDNPHAPNQQQQQVVPSALPEQQHYIIGKPHNSQHRKSSHPFVPPLKFDVRRGGILEVFEPYLVSGGGNGGAEAINQRRMLLQASKQTETATHVSLREEEEQCRKQNQEGNGLGTERKVNEASHASSPTSFRNASINYSPITSTRGFHQKLPFEDAKKAKLSKAKSLTTLYKNNYLNNSSFSVINNVAGSSISNTNNSKKDFDEDKIHSETLQQLNSILNQAYSSKIDTVSRTDLMISFAERVHRIQEVSRAAVAGNQHSIEKVKHFNRLGSKRGGCERKTSKTNDNNLMKGNMELSQEGNFIKESNENDNKPGDNHNSSFKRKSVSSHVACMAFLTSLSSSLLVPSSLSSSSVTVEGDNAHSLVFECPPLEQKSSFELDESDKEPKGKISKIQILLPHEMISSAAFINSNHQFNKPLDFQNNSTIDINNVAASSPPIHLMSPNSQNQMLNSLNSTLELISKSALQFECGGDDTSSRIVSTVSNFNNANIDKGDNIEDVSNLRMDAGDVCEEEIPELGPDCFDRVEDFISGKAGGFNSMFKTPAFIAVKSRSPKRFIDSSLQAQQSDSSQLNLFSSSQLQIQRDVGVLDDEPSQRINLDNSSPKDRKNSTVNKKNLIESNEQHEALEQKVIMLGSVSTSPPPLLFHSAVNPSASVDDSLLGNGTRKFDKDSPICHYLSTCDIEIKKNFDPPPLIADVLAPAGDANFVSKETAKEMTHNHHIMLYPSLTPKDFTTFPSDYKIKNDKQDTISSPQLMLSTLSQKMSNNFDTFHCTNSEMNELFDDKKAINHSSVKSLNKNPTWHLLPSLSDSEFTSDSGKLDSNTRLLNTNSSTYIFENNHDFEVKKKPTIIIHNSTQESPRNAPNIHTSSSSPDIGFENYQKKKKKLAPLTPEDFITSPTNFFSFQNIKTSCNSIIEENKKTQLINTLSSPPSQNQLTWTRKQRTLSPVKIEIPTVITDSEKNIKKSRSSHINTATELTNASSSAAKLLPPKHNTEIKKLKNKAQDDSIVKRILSDGGEVFLRPSTPIISTALSPLNFELGTNKKHSSNKNNNTKLDKAMFQGTLPQGPGREYRLVKRHRQSGRLEKIKEEDRRAAILSEANLSTNMMISTSSSILNPSENPVSNIFKNIHPPSITSPNNGHPDPKALVDDLIANEALELLGMNPLLEIRAGHLPPSIEDKEMEEALSIISLKGKLYSFV